MSFKFYSLGYREVGPDEKPSMFGFPCPRRSGEICGGLLLRSSPHVADGTPQPPKRTWEWDGDREAPTLRPSINCKAAGPNGEKYAGCGWHGWITKGELRDA